VVLVHNQERREKKVRITKQRKKKRCQKHQMSIKRTLWPGAHRSMYRDQGLPHGLDEGVRMRPCRFLGGTMIISPAGTLFVGGRWRNSTRGRIRAPTSTRLLGSGGGFSARTGAGLLDNSLSASPVSLLGSRFLACGLDRWCYVARAGFPCGKTLQLAPFLDFFVSLA
jgi:hypothetical protein